MFEMTKPSGDEYAGLGRLLKAAGVPPFRVERLVADLIAEEEKTTRTVLLAEIQRRLDANLAHTRRTLRQTVFEASCFRKESGFRKNGIRLTLTTLVLAIGAFAGAIAGSKWGGSMDSVSCTSGRAGSDHASDFSEVNRP